ncbi:MAG: helix-turn-helix domain-containing protein [Clostridia bacterium]|nr:helix-turn-helix domain-containing protein [Clostridia bacterium]
MEAKDVLVSLRNKSGMTQDDLADRLFVTRQAVSRWERGETLPGPDTLKQLSALYDVSINTLLGSPRKLVCQCCGMPLDDGSLSREPDGAFNEDYCKWCYADGEFVYKSLDDLVDFLVTHMPNDQWTPEQARPFYAAQLKQLKHWQE